MSNDKSYLSVSNCCGANADYNSPMEIRVLDNCGDYDILNGICSKCNKESEFYDKSELVNSKSYE